MAENDDKSKKAKSHIPKRTMKVRAMSTRPFSTGLVDYALWIYMFQDAEDTTDKNAPRGRIWS